MVGTAEHVPVVIGTPVDEHLNPDPSSIPKALEACRAQFDNRQILILRSTVYPGVTALVEQMVAELGLDMDVAFCPERIAEHTAMTELFFLPQLVSSRTERGKERAAALFSPLTDEIVVLEPEENARCWSTAWRARYSSWGLATISRSARATSSSSGNSESLTSLDTWESVARTSLALGRVLEQARPGLVVAVPILAYLARDQWFFYDEWDFLVPSNGRTLLESHGGHWSTVPMLLFRAVRSVVGLDTYAPYVAMVIAAHLALTHVLWRIAVRAANPWIATLLAGVFSLLGAGAENIFWAFQVGFVGGLLAATTAAYLVDVRELTPARAIAAGVVGLIAVATSGTALPVMVAAVVLACYRHGWRKAAAVFGPAVVAYALWYVTHRDAIDNQHARRDSPS